MSVWKQWFGRGSKSKSPEGGARPSPDEGNVQVVRSGTLDDEAPTIPNSSAPEPRGLVEEFFELLRRGVPEWNVCRGTVLIGQSLHFRGLNFESLGDPPDFSGIDLSRSDLAGAILPDRMRFVGANLEGCDFSGNWLRNVDFTRANLHNANFAGAQIESCIFASADLRNANFAFARLTTGHGLPGEQTLIGADLTDAQIEGLLVMGAKICTHVGYLPKTVCSVEEFFDYAKEANMKTGHVQGRPRCEGAWVGVFRRYDPA